jgi:hypothetical protein
VRRDYSPIRNGVSPRDGQERLPHREGMFFGFNFLISVILGPRTPPLEHEPASDHSHDQDLLEEEHEIFDIVRRMFKECYQDDRNTQVGSKS